MRAKFFFAAQFWVAQDYKGAAKKWKARHGESQGISGEGTAKQIKSTNINGTAICEA